MTTEHVAADFPVAWEDPAEAELSWEFDGMHHPTALSPLAGDYFRVIGQGLGYRYQRLGLPVEMLVRVWNGYAYLAARVTPPPGETEEEFGRRATEARRERIPVTAAYWRDEAMPALRAGYDWFRALPVEAMPAGDLAATWESAWQRIEKAWRIHFYAIIGPYRVLDDLADAYEEAMPDANPADALTLIQGRATELAAVEDDIDALGSLAGELPDVAAALRDGRPLPASASGEGFREALAAFLERHGHLGQSYDDLALPSWVEEPQLLLTQVALRLGRRSEAANRRAGMQAEAEQRVAAVRERLAGEPDKVDRFEWLLRHALDIGPLTERHNYWIDRMAQSTLRRFCLRVGARLAREGVLADAADVLFLRRDETPALIRRPTSMLRDVAERRALHERQRAMKPPPYVGKAPEAGRNRFDPFVHESAGTAELRGVGASSGVARGPARIVFTPADFARVRPGDVVVGPSSNPSWLPLFTIVAGLVTDTGGVLSHAAVVAREFALPAVVGTGNATERIPDGRMVELDGATGFVRLL
jgi:pyruvate,water dikinase